jgi:hypothetical protein
MVLQNSRSIGSEMTLVRAEDSLLHSRVVSWLALLLCIIAGCDGEQLIAVNGQVLIDGQPAESGVVVFRSDDGTVTQGTKVIEGRFEFNSKTQLAPGKYLIAAQCDRKTGRTRNDPQLGVVEETAPLELVDNNQRIEITPDTADDLKLEFHTKTQ